VAALIKVENLTKVYSNEGVKTLVLRGLDLTVTKGEFVAIMGPSGSGKSTLMHILGFLDAPTSGKYFYAGHDVSTLSDEDLAVMRRTQVGFVFQAFFLLPRLTVLENVMLPLIYQGQTKVERRRLAMKAVKDVGLLERADYLTTKLSGGEKQRVAIARAIVADPAVIFADEPTGNLDSASGAQVMEIMRKLNGHGHTIILVTHETTTAEFARRIVKIKDGRITGDIQVVNHVTAETYKK
jgi:putative ABC transport system ATP-binding protein